MSARAAGQLAFDLPLAPSFSRENFLVSPSNEAAWAQFDAWPNWPGRTLLLLGPTGAGKSHLGAIWAETARAKIVPAAALVTADLQELAQSPAILVEDADRGGVEKELFHLINLVTESGAYLAVTARLWPDSWGLQTKDLLSRLRRAPAVEIGEPDDGLVRAVLVKLFMDRQLQVEATVIEFLAARIERSLAAARSVVTLLDREALARGRAVTRPMASEVLKRLEDDH
ncbi:MULTISPECIES: DnaA/Hda family protein [unclassified Beijerinckia]|uniref:DnaA ATPase domain-containing protein n=1 Tax=unclassified Beijerinckia TaxID=2638183 RepID=UPI00089ABD4C|nr:MULTISPECIES: DnaA/Hda family protein [unclassified Beijerinckia]MDH7795680.1 chromosomal replication initiation ATPase DnaA [Beijerinckia sp. GAS462]SEC11594.1 dnaA protein [Beijerinckia sp. 28-YEA-48]